MKNTKLIIALALALGLAACGNQPKSNENTDPTPATVTETPFDWGMLKLGMEIPKTIEGCTIEPVTYMAEGEQQVEYAIKKDGKTLAILEPEFDVDLMELTNKVGVIAIHSEEYQTDKGFHVGSNINDIFAAYPDMLTTGTCMSTWVGPSSWCRARTMQAPSPNSVATKASSSLSLPSSPMPK